MKYLTKIKWKTLGIGLIFIVFFSILNTAYAAPQCRGTPVAACSDKALVPIDQCGNFYLSIEPTCDGGLLRHAKIGSIEIDVCSNGTLPYKGMQCANTGGHCMNTGGYCHLK